MKSLLPLIFLFCFITDSVKSNTLPQYYKFRVYLKDKGNNNYSIDQPLEFLTQNAIERKRNQEIKIDETDFPISPDYFNLISKSGGEVVSYSKWFETIVVRVSDSLKVDNISSLSFVDSVKYVWRGNPNTYGSGPRPRITHDIHYDSTASFYGDTKKQFLIHNANNLFEAGYKGKGFKVGVIDAGFTNFDVIPYFNNVDLIGYKDFVPEGNIFSASDHGTKVLSTMTAFNPGRMMGSAPEASYLLLRSEDVTSEFPVEEDYWIRAIEYADSLGIDVINTSLGYSEFDDKELNYTHDDLTGKTSIMSKAADIAFEKGMLVIVSAGNEGNKIWKKTTPPSDAKNVISVGAVGYDSIIAPFSSYGYTADGRFKPDFVSVGLGTVTIDQHGVIGTTSGTSLSSPFLAGLITSLWSVNPELDRKKLVDILIKSSDRHINPDSIYGNGIINFQIALKETLQTLEVHNQNIVKNNVIIEPVQDGVYEIIQRPTTLGKEIKSVSLLDESGRLLSNHNTDGSNATTIILSAEIKNSNNFIHFVLEGTQKNKTIRIKL